MKYKLFFANAINANDQNELWNISLQINKW